MSDFDYIIRKRDEKPAVSVDAVSFDVARTAHAFLSTFEGYAYTPLRKLDALAQAFGVSRVFVKDESHRFGLNAFKVLGSGFAMGKYLARKLGRDISELSFDSLTSEETRAKLGEVTFVTATDGNHGRGVAWMANKLGQKAVVYMPKGSSRERLQNIKKENADAYITELNYDGAVHLAESDAAKRGWVLMQDTAWDGYEEIPTWITQGYLTLSCEIYRQLEQIKEPPPTHIILQAGVGSFASSVLGFFTSLYGNSRPITIIAEPKSAACIYETARADDGKLRFVTGDMNTIMAGLACGEPSTISYRIIDAYADAFVTCGDEVAAEGMRLLGNPMGGDARIVSGESGAMPAGLLREIMRSDSLSPLRGALGFNRDSRILLISTEGDTDRENYRSVVWDGAYPSF
ncbi:MAG: diaminopropionate ammonia-lyase [Oscillospiraceae bacterium]|jgi:diaminopropionate ammonia-lyase|nr:diaminopropionate ammonia-lyase [Oscillospiraceae bacterium]